MIPVGLMSPGEKGEIAALRVQKPDLSLDDAERSKCDCRIEDMGLRVGKQVEMLSNGGGGGAVLLKVDDSRIAIDRGLAMKIMVKEVKQ